MELYMQKMKALVFYEGLNRKSDGFPFYCQEHFKFEPVLVTLIHNFSLFESVYCNHIIIDVSP